MTNNVFRQVYQVGIRGQIENRPLSLPTGSIINGIRG